MECKSYEVWNKQYAIRAKAYVVFFDISAGVYRDILFTGTPITIKLSPNYLTPEETSILY